MIGVLATDYIPNDTKVVPKAVRRCGGHFLGFSGGITDGGEAAYFEVNQNIPMVTDCVMKTFPQADLRPSTLARKKTAKGPEIDYSATDLMSVR
ncbi:hypothetical protein EWE75_14240 [Sphingomonas populi]|uniref:Uncharacterized protein n=1 Tax=Sphingomonas populi TaxID=2484750 RepID=A0A4Q6Y370_9SPHN|nr:hypothetical protein [Sphingomonas populi]RZF63789.1 hypothetical protein EWE75_14240 [Sphingomonas populi]